VKKRAVINSIKRLFPPGFVAVVALLILQAGLAWAGEAFSVSDFSPQGLVTEAANIRISFSNPVISSDDIGLSPDKSGMPVVFSPPLDGHGVWISRSEFLYQLPDGYMPEATAFTAVVPAMMKDSDGNVISGNRMFKFNTEPLKLLSARQVGYYNGNVVEYEMLFNAPIDASNLVRRMMNVRDKNGATVALLRDSYGRASSSLIFQVDAGDGSPITVNISEGLTPSRGNLPMEKPATLTLDRDLSLKITDSRAENGYGGGNAYIILNTTAEVDVESARDFIEITPDIGFDLNSSSAQLRIAADFPPRELITVKVKAGLPSLDGDGLRETWEKAFIFPDHEPMLKFATSGTFISPAGEALLIPFAAENVNKMNFSVSRVYDNNVSFITKDEWPYYLYNTADNIYEKVFDISSEPNKVTEFSVDLGKILNGKTGLFMLSAAYSENYWYDDHRLINVTDLAGSAKVGVDGIMVWANSISRGEPVSGVNVEVYSNSNQIIATGITDKQGALLIQRNSDWEPKLFPSTVILKKGGDTSVLRLNDNIWRTGSQAYIGAPYDRGKYVGYIYMARGILRPGETVPIQMLVRDSDMSPEQPFPVQLKVTNPMGREWNSQVVMLSKYGMASAEIPLADSCPTGTWRAEISIPGESAFIATETFLVEDFAPPKIEMALSSDQKELRYGDEPTLQISARYLFGAAGSGLEYEVETTLIPREYSHPDWLGYRFSDQRVSFAANNDMQAQGTLSENGSATVELPQITHDAKSIIDAAFRVGVREDGGRWVYKSVTVPYYPRNILLGIKTAEESLTANTTNILSFASIDPEGKPVDPGNVTLSVSRAHARTITTTSSDGKRRTETQSEYIPIEGFDNKPISFKDGLSSVEVPFKREGYYRVILESSEDEKIAASREFYVFGSQWAYGEYGDEDDMSFESVTIKLDKDKYRVGEIAKATISGAFDGSMLLSVETDRVLHYDAATGEKNAEFSFEVTKSMAPNAWVTAHMVRAAAAEDSWAPHRAFGAVPIIVDCSDMKLDVEITSPEKIKPAEENTFKVKLTDLNGKGTPGQITVMLVDEGVLGLTNFKTPNFYEHYTRKRALTLLVNDIYDQLMPLYLQTPPVLTPGGGDDGVFGETLKASMSPVRANRFKILTVVKTIEADNEGNADFVMDVPEFSGKARLMAVASSQNAFGSGEQTHTIARDVVADITLPRVLAPGDTFDSQIQLFNRSDGQKEITVTLGISGPISLVSENGVQTPNIPLGKKEYVKTINLPVGERAFSIPIVLTADNESGVTNVTLKTKYDDLSQSQTIELAVRPPYPRVTKSGTLSLKPGETSLVDLPSDWFPGTRRAVVSMSGIPSIGMTDMANYLLAYPYGCLEQTTSRGWTLLSTPELASQIDANLVSLKHVRDDLSRVIMRIQSMQSYSGSFSPWPFASGSEWLSVYATHFLLECQKEGVDVPRETLRSAVEYLKYMISETPRSEGRGAYGASLAARSYAAYILARKGEAPLAWMSYLKDNLKSMPDYGRVLLAAAYAASGDKKTASTLLGEEAPMVIPNDGRGNLNFDSELRTMALRLLAWCEIDPSASDAVAAASRVVGGLRGVSYYTTQEASWGLLALSKFYSFNNTGGEAKLALSSEKIGLLVTASGDETVTRKINEAMDSLQVTNSGSGVGYVSWTADGVPLSPPTPENNGMSVNVKYYDSKGYEITKGSIVRAGEKVIGRITVRTLGSSLYDAVIALPLPGGLEIENQKYTEGQNDSSYDEENSRYYYSSRTEARDDRLLLFVDYIGKEFKWNFSMRAITPGTFILPPVAAEGMYSPGIRSVGTTSTITIK
jgi:uncharacterized protein YfaS (alpha-2-macroglobulin family)